ncbi:MAG TPA: DUF4097 family beta strand repeat-containing protein [Pyrinomonadaceae bacterium]|nr:DUF4097 family beta strand repeat-containing protein [Pyrinomonadaceae bacterium]
MKFPVLIIIIALAACPVPETWAQRRAPRGAEARGREAVERTVAAAPDAAVALCINEGDVVVRGWDRPEVQARAEGAANLRLQPLGGVPARRVEVAVTSSEDGAAGFGDCGSADHVELSVPRGASVSLTTRNGHTEVSGVAEVRVDAFSGDVGVTRFSRSVEVNSLSGDLSVTDGTGRVRLRAVSGGIEATGLRRLGDNDVLDVTSTSGDVMLRDVSYTRVRGATISGNVEMSGALERGGSYDFKTISGDVIVTLPADASFKLHASVVSNGEVITDFPVTLTPGAAAAHAPPQTTPMPPPPPAAAAARAHGRGRASVGPGPVPMPGPHPEPPGQARLIGTVGEGDAELRISSFSGTLRLKRRQ